MLDLGCDKKKQKDFYNIPFKYFDLLFGDIMKAKCIKKYIVRTILL